MLAVLEISQPCFQSWGVVFADHLTICDDFGCTGDGGPLACGIEEGNIDFGVVLEIVGFAGFGVGVEEKVDATAFLYEDVVLASRTNIRW